MDAVLTSAQVAALLVLDGTDAPIDSWNRRTVGEPIYRVNNRAVDSLTSLGLARPELRSLGGFEFVLRWVITDDGRVAAAKIRDSLAKAGR